MKMQRAKNQETQVKVNIRMATAEDYEAVMDINRHVYADFDYLPSHYFYFLHNPDVYMWVAELDGKIIGFSAAYLMDGRTVACNIAARVHPQYQGLGIFAHLIEGKHHDLQRSLPHAFYNRYVEVYNPSFHLGDGKHRDGDLKVVGMYNHLVYTVSSNRLVQGFDEMKAASKPTPKSFDVGKTIEILQRQATMNILTKNSDYITAHAFWLPIKVTKDNLARLAKQSSVYFTMDGPQCEAVSFCSVTLCTDHFSRVQIDYFGLYDVTTFVNHVSGHMRDVSTTCGDVQKFRVVLSFPTQINPGLADESVGLLLGERNMEGRDFQTTGTVIISSKAKIMPIAKL